MSKVAGGEGGVDSASSRGQSALRRLRPPFSLLPPSLSSPLTLRPSWGALPWSCFHGFFRARCSWVFLGAPTCLRRSAAAGAAAAAAPPRRRRWCQRLRATSGRCSSRSEGGAPLPATLRSSSARRRQILRRLRSFLRHRRHRRRRPWVAWALPSGRLGGFRADGCRARQRGQAPSLAAAAAAAAEAVAAGACCSFLGW